MEQTKNPSRFIQVYVIQSKRVGLKSAFINIDQIAHYFPTMNTVIMVNGIEFEISSDSMNRLIKATDVLDK